VGHGAAFDGDNFLIPKGFPSLSAPSSGRAEFFAQLRETLQGESMKLSTIMDRMTASGLKNGLVIIDACRNVPGTRANPVVKSAEGRSLPEGFERGPIRNGVSSGNFPDIFRIFATDPRNVANDGNGSNSPFVTAFLKHIGRPGVSVSDLVSDVSKDVRTATGGKQVPWIEGSPPLFYFVEGVQGRGVSDILIGAGGGLSPQ
jgi:Caspase domain